MSDEHEDAIKVLKDASSNCRATIKMLSVEIADIDEGLGYKKAERDTVRVVLHGYDMAIAALEDTL